jgi:hypothetical protein
MQAGVTTIEAVNATGILCAKEDKPGHVSVTPMMGTNQEWIDAGSNSIWTVTLKSIVVKWDGRINE